MYVGWLCRQNTSWNLEPIFVHYVFFIVIIFISRNYCSNIIFSRMPICKMDKKWGCIGWTESQNCIVHFALYEPTTFWRYLFRSLEILETNVVLYQLLKWKRNLINFIKSRSSFKFIKLTQKSFIVSYERTWEQITIIWRSFSWRGLHFI